MEFTVRINGKAVLTVVTAGALMVGSFLAGMRYQEHKTEHTATLSATEDPFAAIARPIKVGDTLIIPDSEAADNEASWCKAHPDTKWTFGPAPRDRSDPMHISDVLVPIHGGCDQSGQVWVINDHK